MSVEQDGRNRMSGVDPKMLMGAMLFRKQQEQQDDEGSSAGTTGAANGSTPGAMSPRQMSVQQQTRPVSGSPMLQAQIMTRSASGSVASANEPKHAREASASSDKSTRPTSNSIIGKPKTLETKASTSSMSSSNGPKSPTQQSKTATPDSPLKTPSHSKQPSSVSFSLSRTPSIGTGLKSVASSQQIVPASTGIIEAVAAPSDSRLIESNNVFHEKPAGPRKRHASTRVAFTDVMKNDTDEISKSLDPDLVDQIKFVNPLLETTEKSGNSVPVETALAMQAREQMKSLKKVDPEARKSLKPADKPLSEAQLALSRLKKVENSPAKKHDNELEKMFSRDLNQPPEAKPVTPPIVKVEGTDVKETNIEVAQTDKDEAAKKAAGCCIIL